VKPDPQSDQTNNCIGALSKKFSPKTYYEPEPKRYFSLEMHIIF
jgi:hypothetical protein